jgi:hypothetical protein
MHLSSSPLFPTTNLLFRIMIIKCRQWPLFFTYIFLGQAAQAWMWIAKNWWLCCNRAVRLETQHIWKALECYDGCSHEVEKRTRAEPNDHSLLQVYERLTQTQMDVLHACSAGPGLTPPNPTHAFAVHLCILQYLQYRSNPAHNHQK